MVTDETTPSNGDLSLDYGFPACPRCPHRSHHAWFVARTTRYAADHSAGLDSPRGCKPLTALLPNELLFTLRALNRLGSLSRRALRRFRRTAGKDFRFCDMLGSNQHCRRVKALLYQLS